MKLDENLNLVFPLYRDDAADADPYAWVHSTPISREMFDRYYRVLSLVMADLPRIGGSISLALNCFRDAAESVAGKEADKLTAPLLAEIKRLSEVVVATSTGWDRMPLEDAEAGGHLLPDDMREVMSALIFFSAAWHNYPRRGRREFLDLGVKTLGAQIIASEPTLFFASLPTLTKAATGSPQQPAPATTATITGADGEKRPVSLAL